MFDNLYHKIFCIKFTKRIYVLYNIAICFIIFAGFVAGVSVLNVTDSIFLAIVIWAVLSFNALFFYWQKKSLEMQEIMLVHMKEILTRSANANAE